MTPPFRAATRAAAGLLAVSLACAAGCNSDPGKGTISGKITVNGKPLPGGMITFLPEGGKRDPFSAAIVNGEYSVPDVTAGPAKAYITSHQGEEPPPIGKGDITPVPRPGRKGKAEVPAKYGNPDTSGLALTVQKGDNTFDADLK